MPTGVEMVSPMFICTNLKTEPDFAGFYMKAICHENRWFTVRLSALILSDKL